MKMGLYGVIVAILTVKVYSAISRVSILDGDEPLTTAAANIADVCLGSSERWSELLLISDHISNEILEKIHHQSKTSNSIVSLDSAGHDKFTNPKKCYNHANTGIKWQESKPTGVVIATQNVEQLESALNSLRNDVQRTWRPESYFIVILQGARCDVEECNDMLKVIWDYWILNAVILCSSNNSANENRSEIELYTFNPYSAIHSQQWETIIKETVEVSIKPGNFNHSWYIFKQRFTEIQLFEECGDLFFDKTSNLDGYVIPISFGYSEFLSDTTESLAAKVFNADSRTLKTLAKQLRFKVAQVLNNNPEDHGQVFENGTYTGILDDVHSQRSHLAPTMRGLRNYPGIGMNYAYDVSGMCLASRKAGNRPQLSNLAEAKHIWIVLGIGLLFSTIVLYLQNKPHGIVSAFLDAERLIIGSSIIRMSTVVKHRIILGSIFLTVLVIDGALRSRFISILTITRPYPNLETIEQIKEPDVEVYGHHYYQEVVDLLLNKRMNGSQDIQDCLDNLKYGLHRRVCFLDCRSLQLIPVSPDIHIALTPLWSYYLILLTAMHWPMRDRYNLEVQKLVEAHIFRKWQLDLYWELELKSWKSKRATEPPNVRPAGLNDLLPAGVLLFVGLSNALIVFIWEMKCSSLFRRVAS